MKRPQSAKPGQRGYWGQANPDESSQNNNRQAGRQQPKILRPDLTMHDFARILPKKIHQDKQRLYSEALQLKQSLNEVVDENVRLKTKIFTLEKEKEKMNKYLESAPEQNTRGGNSRLQLYSGKNNDKENAVVRNLKKLIRDSKEENDYLKNENQKIKKTIKYSKINQLQIQKKIVQDENKRLNNLLEECRSLVQDQEQTQRENSQLKKYLEDEIEQNKQLSEENQKYGEIVEELEDKIKTEIQKFQTKQKKLQRQLALEKRKNLENQKYIEDLKKQIKNLQIAQNQAFEKKKILKPSIRPASSHPSHQRPALQNAQSVQSTIPAPKFQQKQKKLQSQPNEKDSLLTEQIISKNMLLQKQLKDIKAKLEQSQNQVKRKTANANFDIQEKQELIPIAPKQQKSLKKIIRPEIIVDKEELLVKKSEEQKTKNKELTVQSPIKKEQSYQDGFEQESYEQQFEQSQKPQQKMVKQDQKSKRNYQEQQIEKLKNDFEENDVEEQLYKKEQKTNKDKKGQKLEKGEQGKKKKKDAGKKAEGYKPDKKILSEIKQLLTYRMKSQRYPFEDLQSDISSAQTSSFTYADLCNMLVNQPFYLTTEYTKIFLNYCYEKEKIGQNDSLTSKVLISKLRKVIEDFKLMDQNQQKEMIIRIAEMTSTYPDQLEVAFENIKNGEETVGKKDLIEMFQKLELQDKYIELIIAQLSLCSDDLEHLNFHGFFQRFFIEDGGYQDDNAIQQQGQQSEQSYRHSSRVKNQGKNAHKPSQDEQQQVGHYMLAPEQPVGKIGNYNDEDIVSDDGRI